ncbi:glycosyltransferase family 4 protein [Aerococcus urinaeequi]|uniref:glycosyltransferase family 4 protein n=1 Tax=Aerococcus urinaeequi TaxID=51665 RepID=UPI003B3B3A45
MDNKKVLFLVNHDVVIYNFRLELVEHLINEGFEVHISSPKGEKIDRLIELGCIYHEIDMDRRGTNIFKDINIIKEYFTLVKNIKPRVVLTYTIKPNIYGGLVSRIQKTPYLTNITGLGSSFTPSSSPILKGILKFLYKISLKKSKCIFFQNKENSEMFDKLQIFAEQSKLLPGSGVNTERFAYAEYPKNKDINIYYFGRLMEEKGTYELLKAAESVTEKYNNVKFHLVGFSEDENLTKIIEKMHNENVIIYHGYQTDINKYIINSDVVVQPSHHEGMSNVLLEAASAGRPVIASNIPGCKEIIENNQTGILFEPKNIESLINALEEFINIPIERRTLMGKLGRQKMIREFSRGTVVQEYMEQIYNIN